MITTIIVGGARTALVFDRPLAAGASDVRRGGDGSALAGSMVAGAATTTFGVLLDTDNNINSGCTIITADGSFAGVELVLNHDGGRQPTGYRVTALPQSCTGSSLSAPVTLDSAAYPVARGFGANGTSAVETYIPTAYLPQSGLKMRIGLTTSGLTVSPAQTRCCCQRRSDPVRRPATAGGSGAVDDGAGSYGSVARAGCVVRPAAWLARHAACRSRSICHLASGQIIAAIVRDGLITDWSGVSALATDPLAMRQQAPMCQRSCHV